MDKLDNLDEKDNFLETHELSKLTQKENLYRSITREKQENSRKNIYFCFIDYAGQEAS